MDEQFPQLHDPQLAYMTEAPGMPVGIDMTRTAAEFSRDVSLGLTGMKAGDVITITSETYGGEDLVTRLPVTEVRRDPLAHGKPMGTQVIVEYNGGPATLDGSKFSTAGNMRKLGIQAGLYPLLRVPNPGTGRPTEETLDRAVSFKLERPNDDGVLAEVPLNSLDKLEAYDSPNKALITEADHVLNQAIHTILPGVDLMHGVRGKVDAGDSSIRLEVLGDRTQVIAWNKKTGHVTKLSRYPNGSLGVTRSEVLPQDAERADQLLEWGYYPLTDGDTTNVEYNFNDKQKDLDGAVTVGLSSEDVKAMGLGIEGRYSQTLYGDGVLSNESPFKDVPTILAFRDGKPVLLSKPEREFEPTDVAHEVMRDVAAAVKDFGTAFAAGKASGHFNRSELVEGGLTLERLELPTPNGDNTAAITEQKVKNRPGFRQVARAWLRLATGRSIR